MAEDVTGKGYTAAARHVYGPRPLGALLPAVTRPAFRRHGAAAAQVLADWEAIVGPALSAVTVPKRLARGTLTIACAGPIAMELQHLSGELIGRIAAHFGQPVVTALRFVQTGEPVARPAEPPPAPPDPRTAGAAARKVAGLPPGELRDALASLGRVVLERRAGKPPSTPDPA